MNIQEIKVRYGIESNDLDDIRAELKMIIKENHPDNTGEKCDNEYFYKVLEDFSYVEKLRQDEDTILSESKIVNALYSIIKNPTQLSTKNESEVLNQRLDKSIDSQLVILKKRRRGFKYGSAGIVALITFLWVFPEQIIQHPIINVFTGHIDVEKYVIIISFIWLIVTLLTCCLWFICLFDERIEKQIMDDAKLESIQNSLFMKYISYNYEEHKKSFYKNEFMNYIFEQLSETIKKKSKNRISKIPVREEIIQTLADIILKRAEAAEIIKKVNTHSLIDCYEIISI